MNIKIYIRFLQVAATPLLVMRYVVATALLLCASKPGSRTFPGWRRC